MTTYTKNGMRAVKVQQKNNVKKQVKEFYTRVKQIDEIVKYLITLEEKVTEENINEIVSELIGRDLDSLEKNIILNKLQNEK